MREWSGNYPLRLLVGCMKVSRTAYYAWLVRVAGPGRNETEVKEKVVELFHYHRGRYGSKRLSAELKAGGVRAGRFVVRRFMREEGLRAKGPRVFRPRTTDSRHSKHASPNLLKELDNTAFEAGHAIVGDITYLPLTNGRFCYMAMFQDKRTKRVVGWSVGSRMTAELATEALRMALRRGLVERNAIIHTDRGSQYASGEFRRLIGRCSLRQSMSGKGNCYDNAQAESFFSRFKTEIDSPIFASTDEARHAAFDYIDCYYNRIRHHSTLRATIPEFEQRLKTTGPKGRDNLTGCGNMEKPKAAFPHSHNHYC